MTARYELRRGARDVLVSRCGPFPRIGTRCYGCDAAATGVRDRRDEGGMIEPACARHTDSTVPTFPACMYCNGPRPTVEIDGYLAHRGCHRKASR